jgi:F-box-like
MAPPPMPSLGYESTAHRVLAIPELLQTIFSFGTRVSNASNALVCRNWREAALDNVWREIDDMYYLLHLLSPLYRRGETDFYVRRPCILGLQSSMSFPNCFMTDVPPHSNTGRLGPFCPLCSPRALSQIRDRFVRESAFPRRQCLSRSRSHAHHP